MGSIAAIKERGRWHIKKADFARFQDLNKRALEKTRKEYIALYREGLTVIRLKEKTREDFESRGIIHGDIKGFAEWTIYNYIMAERKGERAKQ